jgi:transposase
MAQGKSWNKEKIIELLKEYLKLGYSVNKACEISGIAQSTVQTWIDKDEELRLKINSWQNEPSVLARRNWIEALKYGKPSKFGDDKYTPAKDWLERKEKNEFSLRQEVTGKDGEKIQLTWSNED